MIHDSWKISDEIISKLPDDIAVLEIYKSCWKRWATAKLFIFKILETRQMQRAMNRWVASSDKAILALQIATQHSG
jgi:hypothetical protein